MGLAFRIGLPRKEFWEITPKLFSIYVEEYQNKESNREKGEWERARFVATFTLLPHSKKALKPKDLVIFPWEESEIIEVIKELPQSIKELAAAMDAKAKKEGLIK